MIKQTQRIKLGFLQLLKEELLGLVAVLVVAVFGLMANAQTSDRSEIHFVICPAGGSLTITRANGGERWQIDDTENIRWSTCDPEGVITDVKIELQRAPGGLWETLIESTPSDGVYAWPVTSPTTTTALLRISNASDSAMTDTSDDVFEIYDDSGTPPTCENIVIDNVTPRTFSNFEDTTLIITGYFPRGDELVYLDDELLDSTYISQGEIDAIVPAGFSPGNYILRVTNFCGTYAEYENRIIVYEEECHSPVINEVSPILFANTEDVTLTIKGYFEYGDEEVYLGDEWLELTYVSEEELRAVVPSGFPVGSYTLSVLNGCGGRAEYGTRITVYEEEEEDEDEEEEEPESIIDIIIKPILDIIKPFIKPPSTGGIVQPKPTSPFVPKNKFYTDQFEQNWICYLTWLIILSIFSLLLKEYFKEDALEERKE